MKRLVGVAASLGLLFHVSSAGATVSGDEFMGTSYDFQLGYVVGVMDTWSGAAHCPRSVSNGEILESVRAMLRQMKRSPKDVSLTVVLALSERGCKTPEGNELGPYPTATPARPRT
jgi:hypothetical protein